MTSIADYRSARELAANLTLRELRSKYKRSFLGWAWSLANPLANMVVYTIVFSYFFKASPPHGKPSGLHVYALYLLCGLLPWNYFSATVTGCIGSLVANGNLIKKTYFPRELLPFANVAANLVSHGIEMGLLVVALVAFGDYWALEYLPFTLVLVAVMAVFTFGFGLLLSALNVYFRDIQHFMSILLLVWLYLTPIIYPFTLVQNSHPEVAKLMKLNPMTDAALSYRNVLYNGTFPGWGEFGYFVAWAVGIFLFGKWVFNKLEGGLAEEL
jgi:ABC-type polysaccharide/polyol phosphate export permease